MNSPYNILIAGIGGQGVITLTRTITTLLENSGQQAISSIIKGGAQRLGTVHSVIRIFQNQTDYKRFSPQIPRGSLDLLIALEPWEALRHSSLFSRSTKIVVNSVKQPFLSDRLNGTSNTDPCEELRRLELSSIIKDFESLSHHKHGTKKMTNFELGLESVKLGYLPFSENNYQKYFQECLHKKDHK